VSLAVTLQYMRGGEPLIRERTPVSAGDFHLAVRRLWALFTRGHERRLPLEPERIALLMPGLVLLAALVHQFGIPGFIVTPRDLRWGGLMAGTEVAEHKIDGRRH
jgi:exopolyphosphatase/pppGpp-phosphohydrolase